MATRVVEWKKPYTWWQAIDIDENKVISLRLRDENNLIIYDEWDDEIYVDLQLDDEITPISAFPVWVNTGRVIVDNGWDKTWTIIIAKTTSGDNIKLLYADDWTLWMDNWTWTFKQIYFKADVDLIIQAIQSQIDALSGLGKFLSLWDGETWEPISFPLSVPYDYHTWDWFMINNVDNTTNYRPDWTEYDGTASSTVETQATEIWDVYIYDGNVWLLQKNWWGWGSAVLFSQVLGSPYDNTNLATALNAKQDELTAWTNIQISNNVISATWWDVLVSSQANNIFTSWMKIWWWTQSDYQSLTPDSNTAYLLLADQPTPPSPRQPWADTLAYYEFNNNLGNSAWSWHDLYTLAGTVTYWTDSWWAKYAYFDTNTWSNHYTGFPSIDVSTLTVSYWWKPKQIFSWWNPITLSILDSNSDIILAPVRSVDFRWISWFTATADTWYHIVMVIWWWVQKVYVNWQYLTEWTQSYTWTLSTTFTINNAGDTNSSSFANDNYLSELIIETKSWTAQEVADYYDQTKANYWIS